MGKLGERLQKIFCNPWFDKLIAVVLVGYSVSMAISINGERRGLPLVLLLVRVIVLNGLVLIRRHPQRITVSPLFWIVAMAEAYWDLLFGVFRSYPSVALCPAWFTDGLSIMAFLILLTARISLGRSFGIVAADRGIITTGAYRIVRHPVYTAAYLAVFAYVLSHFSVLTVSLALCNFALTATKALLEEKFLGLNEAYKRYMGRVRYRFFPLIA